MLTWEKQPDSKKLIRDRKYYLCVICEKRDSITSDVMWVTVKEEDGSTKQEPRFLKWWTCLKCEEATK